MAKLTVRGIEALKPKDAGYKVTADRGLYLRVAPDGTKTWLVRYVVAGNQIQARLPRSYGSSGADGHMSLAQAVTENARIQSLARDGIDFQVQRADADRVATEAKAAALAANVPFRTLFETWLADGVSRKDGNAELRRTFEKDILPTLGDKPVRELGDSHLLDLLRGLLLAHFAIRQLMAQAAWPHGLDPDRLSFVHAMRVIKRKMPQAAAIPP